MIRRSQKACERTHPMPGIWCIFAVLLLPLLSACDGGIFGTGDGDSPDPTVVPGMSTDSTGSAPIGSPVDGATTEGTTTDGATTDGTANPGTGVGDVPLTSLNPSTAPYTNSTNATMREDALLRVINASLNLDDSIVVTINDQRDDPLLPLPGLNYIQGSSGYLSTSPGLLDSIEILASESFRQGQTEESIVLSPVDLAPGSVTSLVLRPAPDMQQNHFEVLPLATLGSGTDQVSLRTVHAAKSLATDGQIKTILVPLGGSREQAISGFEMLDYSSQPSSNYVEFEAGIYTVQFEQAGKSITLPENLNPIDLSAGQTLTLIIRDTQNGIPGMDADVLLINDSQLP